VLVVDDNREFRRSLIRLIRATYPRLNVFSAVHGVQALEQLEQIRIRYLSDPLVILLDLHMPEMDGWRLIEKLEQNYRRRGHESGIPVIVFSDTSGRYNRLFSSRSIEPDRIGYEPLISVAKDTCMENKLYDTDGEKGLMQWLEHYIERRKRPRFAGPPVA
jgi:CheY-like chemotaxis protein